MRVSREISRESTGNRALSSLTNEELTCLLANLDLGRYVDGFRTASISGADIVLMTEDDLRLHGVDYGLHRRRLKVQIDEFILRGVSRSLIRPALVADSPRRPLARPLSATLPKAAGKPMDPVLGQRAAFRLQRDRDAGAREAALSDSRATTARVAAGRPLHGQLGASSAALYDTWVVSPTDSTRSRSVSICRLEPHVDASSRLWGRCACVCS